MKQYEFNTIVLTRLMRNESLRMSDQIVHYPFETNPDEKFSNIEILKVFKKILDECFVS